MYPNQTHEIRARRQAAALRAAQAGRTASSVQVRRKRASARFFARFFS